MLRHRVVRAALVVVTGARLLAQQAPAPRPVVMLMPKAVTSVEAKYVTARVGVSDTAIAPGGVLTLIVDIVPKPTMHVYAPGQDGYLPVAITVVPQPAFKLAATTYPPARAMFFEGLQQILKVYDEPFRLTRDVTFTTSAHGSVVLAGTLDYQACDNNVCYRTDQAPLKWAIDVK